MKLPPLPILACGLVLSAGSLYSGEKREELPWSFQPIRKQELPKVKNTKWPKNRIDHFILAKMEEKGLSPSPPADDRMLLRRIAFDLTGLPPKEEDVASFGRGTIRESVDSYLASPHYGERWARHWLDLARYTDTTASWLESTSSAHYYRDWVVNALNSDMPYDDFVRRQLATDLIAETDYKDNAALGFLGLSPTYWKELQLPPEIIKTTVADEWEERVDALGRTFLGLTLACARCHDHKTDPITTQDYYALAGVFASVRIADRQTVNDEIWLPVAKARKEVGRIEAEKKELKKKKPEDLDKQLAALDEKIAAIKKATPHYDVPTVNGVVEAALFVKKKPDGQHGTLLDYKMGEAQDIAMHKRGNPNDTGEVVPRRFLSAFPAGEEGPRRFNHGSGRLDLANALVEEGSPLTARVIVNRIWEHHFGHGLVGTPSEFGTAGEAPSHPELLDDLAFRFMENGWSIKWLQREILNSATWQQSSLVSPGKTAKDPRDLYYSYAKRRRLDVEVWRDAMLASTGELDLKLGGAPGDLEDPKFVRRTIYGKIHRRDLNQMLRAHDFPDPTAHSPVRVETATPLQQLYSLNGPTLMQRAKALAARLVKEAETRELQIDLAYSLLFQRDPTVKERDLALAYLDSGEPLERYTQVLLTSNEFLYLD